MRTLPILICFLQMFILINGVEDLKFLFAYVSYVSKCNKDMNTSFLSMGGFDEQKLICYEKCLLEKMTIFNEQDETYNINNALKIFNPTNQSNLDLAMKQCFTKADNNVCEKTSNIMDCLCVAGNYSCKYQVMMHHSIITCAKELNIKFPINENDDNYKKKCIHGCISKKMGFLHEDGSVNLDAIKAMIPFADRFFSDCFKVTGDTCSNLQSILNCLKKNFEAQKFVKN